LVNRNQGGENEDKQMSIGLVGRKCGMTRIFTDAGDAVPVTVVHVSPNKITQVKSVETDGYTAVQVTTGEKKRNRVSKPLAGHFKKAGIEPGRGLWEFRVGTEALSELKVGDELTVSQFEIGQIVDVTGTSKGKGFAGTVKRHNFSMQDATHGNSVSHRAPGSTGQNQTPGRVFKGKKMAGQMGNERKTIQGLKVVQIDVEKGLLLIKGALPGAPGGDLLIKATTKAGG
jgi:large subunit ribosomal protein L3